MDTIASYAGGYSVHRQNSLLEITQTGFPFTWSNRSHNVDRRVYETSDHALVTPNWSSLPPHQFGYFRGFRPILIPSYFHSML